MPSPYVLGARKVGRPLSEDKAYAEELGVPYRKILLHGGAKYLKSLPEESRNLMFKQLALNQPSRSLEQLGMNVKKPFAVQKAEAFEAYIQALLRERGLR